MENASKALIIAGAILLSILIISLGLMVFNQAKDTAGSSNLDEQTIQAFNSKFTPYEGRKSGSQVNTLIQTVIASNQAETNSGEGKYVTIYKYDSTATDNKGAVMVSSTATTTTKVVTGNTYTVTVLYGGNGLIDTILIN